MIHGIYANQRGFRSVEFSTGLNVVLAERMKASTRKDTRNGLGKTTLIEVIDFCLGSSGTGLRIEPLENWAFTIDVTLASNRVKATRSVKSHTKIVIVGETAGWIEQPDEDKDTHERVLSLRRWKTILGWALFDLPRSDDAHKYKPTHRSLVSYFIRNGNDAYASPFRHFRHQHPWDIQVNIAYLLGLNWEFASDWQLLKDKEDGLKALDTAAKKGAIESTIGTVGELEAERVLLEQQLRLDEEGLSTFKVHPQYDAIQSDADSLTSTIHELGNQNVVERRKLTRYREAVSVERAPSQVSLEKLYNEAGLLFPENVTHTLEEARGFHTKIVENRKAFLELEIERLERGIDERTRKIRELTESRAELLHILDTQGALKEMYALQGRFVDTKEKLERIRALIRQSRDIAASKRELRIAKTELESATETDYEERKATWSAAVRSFNEHSEALYRSPGQLLIDISDKGYKFDVEIKKSRSEGVGKMKVFCFDLMMLEHAKELGREIDFLVHDSIMYDSVDSRQRALAIQRAATVCAVGGTQYICALNSDMVPRGDFDPDFDFDSYVKLTLSDRNISGALLGIQFEKPRE